MTCERNSDQDLQCGCSVAHDHAKDIAALLPAMANIGSREDDHPIASVGRAFDRHSGPRCYAGAAASPAADLVVDQVAPKLFMTRRTLRKSGSRRESLAVSTPKQGSVKEFRSVALTVLLLLGLFLSGCCELQGLTATRVGPPCNPDYYTVTASACYKPVSMPGTQRPRQRQDDAEEIARPAAARICRRDAHPFRLHRQ